MSAPRRNLITVNGTHCKRCNARIAFIISRRTGKPYAVNVLRDSAAQIEVASPIDFHKCPVTEAPAPVTLEGNVQGIFTLFDTAKAKGIRFPKVKLATEDGLSVVLKQAGERSKYMGQIMLTDGMPFGSNRYFGRIDEAGRLIEGRDMTDAVRALIADFAADPAAVGAAYGKRTGTCCFCSRHLETRESVHVGYGPICADKFGLPWGEVPQAEVVAPAAPEAAPEVIIPVGGIDWTRSTIEGALGYTPAKPVVPSQTRAEWELPF